MISKLFCLIGKIIGIHTDAMPTYQSRTEPECIPFRIHAIHHFVGVNAHAVKYHSQFVHKGDVDIALTVFHNLNSFCSFDAGHRVGAYFNHKIINLLNDFQRFFIHTRNDFANVFQSMHFIARIDTFRRIAYLKVHPAFQSGCSFQNRNANVFCDARINSGFIHHNRAFDQISANNFAGANDRSKVGCMVKVNRGWNCHDVKFCITQTALISSKFHCCRFDGFVTNFFCGINARKV